MVFDSNLQSFPVVSIFIGDIFTIYPTPLLRPPPLPYSQKWLKPLKADMSLKNIYLRHGVPRRDFCRSIKVRNLACFHKIFYNLTSTWKTKNLIKFWYNLSKSWLKNLSNENIHAEQNLNRSRNIGIQSWPFRSQKTNIKFYKVLTLQA
jgi:hypothetical protein